MLLVFRAQLSAGRGVLFSRCSLQDYSCFRQESRCLCQLVWPEEQQVFSCLSARGSGRDHFPWRNLRGIGCWRGVDAGLMGHSSSDRMWYSYPKATFSKELRGMGDEPWPPLHARGDCKPGGGMPSMSDCWETLKIQEKLK